MSYVVLGCGAIGATVAACLARDAVLAVTGLGDRPAAEVLGDPRYRPLLLEVARQALAGAPALPGERGGTLLVLAGELARAIEQGRRSRAPSNLDLLAAHERLERLGRVVGYI